VGGLEAGELTELVLEPPGYLALLGYLPYGDEIDAASRACAGGRERFGTPRRGASARAICIRPASCTRAGRLRAPSCSWCTTPTRTRTSPARAYGFRALVQAQADGDLQTLRAHGRPAVRVTLPADDIAGGIDRITERLGNGGSD
jgi:glucose-6-phosphate isomerase/transaldolase/glucose-6-phosphate isomerase